LKLSQLGISFQELGANIATFTRLGVSTDEAATGLRAIMTAIIKPSEQASKAALSLGFTFAGLRDVITKDGLSAALQQVIDKTGGAVEKIGKLFPNVRALKTVLGTTGAQGKKYADIIKEINEESEDLNKNAFGVTIRTNAFKFKKALNDLRIAGVKLGTTLFPIASSIAEGISNMVESFDRLDDSTKDIIKSVAIFAATVGPVIFIIGKFATGIASIITVVKFIIPLMAAFRAQMALINAVMAANPAAAVALAAAALVGVIIALSREGKVLAQTQKILNEVNETAQKNIQAEITKRDLLLSIARDDNKSKEERVKAIKKLNKLNPEYLGALTLENIKTKEATESIKKHTESIFARAKIRAAENKLTELAEKQRQIERGDFAAHLTSLDKLLGTFRSSQSNLNVMTQRYQEALAAVTEEQEELKKVITENSKLFLDNADAAGINTDALADLGDELDSLKNKQTDLTKASKLRAEPIKTIKVKPVLVEEEELPQAQLPEAQTYDPIDKEEQDRIFDANVAAADKFTSDLNSVISSGMQEAITSFAQDLGKLAAGDEDVNIGEGLLNSIASFLGQLGQMMIAAGIAKQIFERIAASGSGPLLIVAGVALVAISSAIGSVLKKGPSGGGGSAPRTGGGGGGGGGAGSVVPFTPLKSIGDKDKDVSFTIQGDKLVGVLKNTSSNRSSLGPNLSTK